MSRYLRLFLLQILLVLAATPGVAEKRTLEDNPVCPSIEETTILWAKRAPYGRGDDCKVAFGDIPLDVLDGSLPAAALDGDYGDFTCTVGACALDADVVAAAEIADGDYGDFTFTGGVASVDSGAVDFNELAGSAADAQIPNTITIDQATLALTGDSATAFFAAGTLEDALIDGSAEADEVNPTLGTQTQGNYLATLADDGQGTVTVTGSGAESAAVTLRVIDVVCTDCLSPTEIDDSYVLNAGDTITGALTFSDGGGDSPAAVFAPQAGTSYSTFARDTDDRLVLDASGGNGLFELSGPDLQLCFYNESDAGRKCLSYAGGGNLFYDADGDLVQDAVDDDLSIDDDVPESGDFGNLTAGRSLTAAAGTIDADQELYEQTKCINIDPSHTTTDWLFFRAERAITIIGIDCIVDAATSVVMTLQECDGDAASCGDTEAAITCGTTNTTEASSIDDASVDAGDWMRVTRGTKTGSPTQASLCVTYTVAD